MTPWTIQSMEFSRPEYWSGQPSPSPGHLPNPGIEPRSPALQADSVPSESPGKPTPNVHAFKKNQNQTQQNCVIPIIYLLEMGKILNHIKRNGILLSIEDKVNPFAITQKNWENIKLSEVSQKQKDKYCMISLQVESKIVVLIAERVAVW